MSFRSISLTALVFFSSLVLLVTTLHQACRHPLITRILQQRHTSSTKPTQSFTPYSAPGIAIFSTSTSVSPSSPKERPHRPSQPQSRKPRRNPPTPAHKPTRSTTASPKDANLSRSPLDPTRFAQDPDARLYAAARRAPVVLPSHVSAACPRALAGPLGHASSDGMGHRLSLVIFELNLAVVLNSSYWHRVTPYGSLTRGDAGAVQRLFGWDTWVRGSGGSRDAQLRRHCATVTRGNAACTRDPNDVHPACMRLRRKSPFRRIVRVPQKLTDCLVDKKARRSTCLDALGKFARRFRNECGILFQARPTNCSFDYRDYDSTQVAAWLRMHYWQRHAASTQLVSPRLLQRRRTSVREAAPRTAINVASKRVTRFLPFRADRLQVVVHVRRGDFFIYKNRILLPDTLYAAVVARVVSVARDVLGRSVNIDVGVYSEGAPAPGQRLRGSSHDVATMSGVYITETGALVRKPTEYWSSLVNDAIEQTLQTSKNSFSARMNARNFGKGNRDTKRIGQKLIHTEGRFNDTSDWVSSGRRARWYDSSELTTEDDGNVWHNEGDSSVNEATESNVGKVRTFAFIATDTIATIHALNCADVVVASFSGLTGTIASKLGRGIILLPRRPGRRRKDRVVERRMWFGVEDTSSDEDTWLDRRNLREGLIQMFPERKLL